MARSQSAERIASNRYGRRGGNWLPALVDGQKPFGVIEGVRTTCPDPVFVVCACQVVDGWWVMPGDVGKRCDWCGAKLRAAE